MKYILTTDTRATTLKYCADSCSHVHATRLTNTLKL